MKTNGKAARTTGSAKLDKLLAEAYAEWLRMCPREWESMTIPFHELPGMPGGTYGYVKLSIQPRDPRRWEPPAELWTEERV